MKRKINTIIGVIEIISGVLGAIAIVVNFTKFFASAALYNDIINTIIVVSTSALYILSILSGYLLLKSLKSGLILSIITHAFQCIQFSIGSLVYSFISFPRVSLSIISSDKLGCTYGIGSSFKIAFTNNGYSSLQLNIVSLFLIIYFIMQLKSENNAIRISE